MQPWRFAIVAASLALSTGYAPHVVNASDDVSSDEKIFNILELATKYNRIVRPPPDYNTTNIVYINFIVLKLLSIDEVGQHMSLEGFTEMEWSDRRLAWCDKFNSSFCHVPVIYLPRTFVWTPDVITVNTVEHKEARQQPLSTVVTSEGRVFISSPFGTKTLCDINMLYFPFDSQSCKVVFGSWLMVKEDLELRLLNRNTSNFATDTDRQLNIESDEYCITRSEFAVTPQTDEGSYQEAVFTIAIQRKPLFYVMNLIIPSFLILIISVFSFFLPPESGERLSLNITLMLSLVVFMQIVAGYTPAQSDSVPMLTRFFAAVVAITAASTVGSVFQLHCHFRGRACRTVHSAAIRAVFLGCQGGAPRRCEEGGGAMKIANSRRADQDEVMRTLRDDEAPSFPGRQQEDGECEWHTVGRRLDCCLFVVMVIATVALALFIGLIRNPDYVTC